MGEAAAGGRPEPSTFILDRYPHATCVAQDGSEPMLNRARHLVAKYGERFKLHQSDLFEVDWLPQQFGLFDAVVSSSCLHNLRDFKRIREIYGDIRAHLKPGGAFVNADLINAPTRCVAPAVRSRRDRATPSRRRRGGGSRGDGAAAATASGDRGPGALPGDPGPTPDGVEGGRVQGRRLLLEGTAPGCLRRLRVPIWQVAEMSSEEEQR